MHSLLRLCKNPIYMILTWSTLIYIIGVAGDISFKPKYLSSQYSIPVWQANIIMCGYCLARGFGSVVNTRLPTQGLRVRSPSLQLKLLIGDMYRFFPRQNAPVYQCFTLLNNLVCHVWWALQYIALWATNRN